MPVCPTCESQVEDGLETCASCGGALEAEAMQFGIVCPTCDTYNGPGQDACASCGGPLVPVGFTGFFNAANLVRPATDAQAPAAPAPAAAQAPAAPAAAQTSAAPAAAQAPAAPAAPAPGSLLCSSCKTPNAAGNRFCGGCGTPLAGGGGTMMMPSFAAVASAAAAAPPAGGTQFFGAMAPGKAKLILIRGEGFEGAEFRLGAQEVKAGRSQGLILFPNDATLGAHHATFVYRDGRLHVRDEGTPSGTYVRLKGSQEITVGTEVVVGCHRLRYLGVLPAPNTRRPGVARPEGAVRFEEILGGGRPGRAWLLSPGLATLGRAGSQIDLSVDRFVSTRHCELKIEGGRTWVTDLGSVNGTFVRLPTSSERGLAHGDYLMLGQQVLRVEIA